MASGTDSTTIERRKQAGAMIRAARERVRPRLTMREAARRAGVSEGWWRQAERGGRWVAEDVWKPFNPQDHRDLANASLVVGLRPEDVFDTAGLPIDGLAELPALVDLNAGAEERDATDRRLAALEGDVAAIKHLLGRVVDHLGLADQAPSGGAS